MVKIGRQQMELDEIRATQSRHNEGILIKILQ